MAISLDLSTSQFGVPFPAAYFRIASVFISRESGTHYAQVDVVGYATKPEDDDASDVEFRRYRAEIKEIDAVQGDTFLSKCYAWIASQPDMEGSTQA